jgi:sugar O-acyltransferase (sialic acid O-acetyltransferase NeuD family)
MPQLVIFGNAQYAEIAHFYFSRDSEYEVVAFSVDEEFITCDTLSGLPVLPIDLALIEYPPESHHFFVAMGYSKMNRQRETVYSRLKAAGYSLASYISSKATWLSQHEPGENCFVLENNTVQPFSVLGSNITLWSGNHVGHHSTIEDHTFVSSHVVISGNVTVGHHSFLGVNCSIADGLKLAPYTLLGAGVSINKDTTEQGVYVPEKAVKLDKKSDYFL